MTLVVLSPGPVLFDSIKPAAPGLLPPDEPRTPDFLSSVQSYLSARRQGEPPPPETFDGWMFFYRRYAPMVKHIVNRTATAPADRDDCMQEAWAEIVRQLPHLHFDEARGTPEALLSTIARRTALKYQRRAQRPVTLQSAGRDEFASWEPVCHREADPQESSGHEEMLQRLGRAVGQFLGGLSATNREVFQCRFIRECTVAETAEGVGLTQKQVRDRQCRLLKRLRHFLDSNELPLPPEPVCVSEAEEFGNFFKKVVGAMG